MNEVMFAVKKFLALSLICALMVSTTTAEAKFESKKVPLLPYAEAPVSVYNSPDGKKKGTIPVGTSLVLVKSIREDGWAYGSYKAENQKRRIYCWFKMSELQGYSNFENYTDQVNYDLEAYRTRTASNYVGKVASNEDLIIVAARGDRVKVIFEADGGYYRMGWIDKNSLKTNSSTTYDNSDDYSSDNYISDSENLNDSTYSDENNTNDENAYIGDDVDDADNTDDVDDDYYDK